MRKSVHYEREQLLADQPPRDTWGHENTSDIENVDMALRLLGETIKRLRVNYEAQIQQQVALLTALQVAIPEARAFIESYGQSSKVLVN